MKNKIWKTSELRIFDSGVSNSNCGRYSVVYIQTYQQRDKSFYGDSFNRNAKLHASFKVHKKHLTDRALWTKHGIATFGVEIDFIDLPIKLQTKIKTYFDKLNKEIIKGGTKC